MGKGISGSGGKYQYKRIFIVILFNGEHSCTLLPDASRITVSIQVLLGFPCLYVQYKNRWKDRAEK
jgi:hypothetical protein